VTHEQRRIPTGEAQTTRQPGNVIEPCSGQEHDASMPTSPLVLVAKPKEASSVTLKGSVASFGLATRTSGDVGIDASCS